MYEEAHKLVVHEERLRVWPPWPWPPWGDDDDGDDDEDGDEEVMWPVRYWSTFVGATG